MEVATTASEPHLKPGNRYAENIRVAEQGWLGREPTRARVARVRTPDRARRPSRDFPSRRARPGSPRRGSLRVMHHDRATTGETAREELERQTPAEGAGTAQLPCSLGPQTTLGRNPPGFLQFSEWTPCGYHLSLPEAHPWRRGRARDSALTLNLLTGFPPPKGGRPDGAGDPDAEVHKDRSSAVDGPHYKWLTTRGLTVATITRLVQRRRPCSSRGPTQISRARFCFALRPG